MPDAMSRRGAHNDLSHCRNSSGYQGAHDDLCYCRDSSGAFDRRDFLKPTFRQQEALPCLWEPAVVHPHSPCLPGASSSSWCDNTL